MFSLTLEPHFILSSPKSFIFMFKDFVFKKIRISASEVLKVWHDPEYHGDLEWLLSFWKGSLENYQMIQKSKQATVVKGHIPSIDHNVFLKKLHVRKSVDYLKNMVRQTRARRAVIMGEKAEEKGFQVSRPLFLMESFKFGLHYESGIITEAIEDAPSVAAWAVSLLRDKPNALRGFVIAYARLIGKWHKSGCYHGDLRSGNVLAKKVNGSWEFYFLDNERNRSIDKLPVSKITHNLMQINMLMKFPKNLRFVFWNEYNKIMGFSLKDSRIIKRRVHDIVKSRLTAKGLYDQLDQ